MRSEYDVTSVGINPADDRAHRMRVYFITMTTRLVCVASLFFVRGWWVLLVGIAVVLLPHFAVLIANQQASGNAPPPEAPAPLELTGATDTLDDETASSKVSEQILIVDAPAERRATQRTASSPQADTEEPHRD